MISVKGASFGRFGGWRRRYPGGFECRSIFLTVSRAMPNRLAASRWLRPSTWQASRTRRYRSTVYILPPSISKKIEGYRWQSFTPPAAGKSRRFRGLICHRRSQACSRHVRKLNTAVREAHRALPDDPHRAHRRGPPARGEILHRVGRQAHRIRRPRSAGRQVAHPCATSEKTGYAYDADVHTVEAVTNVTTSIHRRRSNDRPSSLTDPSHRALFERVFQPFEILPVVDKVTVEWMPDWPALATPISNLPPGVYEVRRKKSEFQRVCEKMQQL